MSGEICLFETEHPRTLPSVPIVAFETRYRVRSISADGDIWDALIILVEISAVLAELNATAVASEIGAETIVVDGVAKRLDRARELAPTTRST